MTNLPSIAILHYTLHPVVGGVEAMIQAQARAFADAGYPLTLIGGTGQQDVFPSQSELIIIPELDSRHPEIAQMNIELTAGRIPSSFTPLMGRLVDALYPVLSRFDHVIVHNVLTRHFNLPLTAALARLAETGAIRHTIAWCHDFSWTGSNSRKKVHPAYPWNLLRTPIGNVTYVTVSERRRQELASLFEIEPETIHLSYNGVEPRTLLGLSAETMALIEQFQLMESDLVLLMPAKITRAKNIEYALKVLANLKMLCRNPRLVVTGQPDHYDADSMQYFQSLCALRDQLGVTREAGFVFESGPDAGKPYMISDAMVGELLRISDVVFMPSHREGFGAATLQAGLLGVPVISTAIPASAEIGRQDIFLFSLAVQPHELAAKILPLVNNNPISRFRRRVRQNYTWDALFHRSVEPLLAQERDFA